MAEDRKSKHFTVEEANLALEVIRPLIEQALGIRQEILRRQPEAWPAIEKAAGNGGNRAALQLEAEFQKLDGIIRQINGLGAVLKDVNQGLVDFPSIRQGREVYLCWRYGEGQIHYWHELDTGFANRKPI